MEQMGSVDSRRYCRNLLPETRNGNIRSIDISGLCYESLENMCYHVSLKDNHSFIDKNGLVPKIGEKSQNLDTQKLIFFSYGIQGVIELWDYWLKWRANEIFKSRNQAKTREDKELIKAYKKGTISEEDKNELLKKYNIQNENPESWNAFMSQWEKDFISGEYKKDKNKMQYLFDSQIVELIASNYYSLDLKENEDYSFDDIDLKKRIMRLWNPNSIYYRLYATMLEGHSDLRSLKLDKWNMTTKVDKEVRISPERIKQLVLQDGSNDALSILLELYDRYKRMTPKEKQVKTELLDQFIKYVIDRIKNEGGLVAYNKGPVVMWHEWLKFLHDQKICPSVPNTPNGCTIISKTLYTRQQVEASRLGPSLDD